MPVWFGSIVGHHPMIDLEKLGCLLKMQNYLEKQTYDRAVNYGKFLQMDVRVSDFLPSLNFSSG